MEFLGWLMSMMISEYAGTWLKFCLVYFLAKRIWYAYAYPELKVVGEIHIARGVDPSIEFRT